MYTLEDQIQHKLDCIDTLIKENGPATNFILVGHSVGSYISAEVLKKRPHHGISRVIALFPTLREIAITPNGVNINVKKKKSKNNSSTNQSNSNSNYIYMIISALSKLSPLLHLVLQVHLHLIWHHL